MIAVRIADLAEAEVTAVIRPVSAEWMAVTPAMRRLELAAGAELEAQCLALGELPVGTAVVTSAGALPAEFVVNLVVRSVEQPVSVVGVQRALRNGLRRVEEWGFTSLAVPPLGTGAGNLDAEQSAEAMVPILLEHLWTTERSLRIEIVVETDYERDAFSRELGRGEDPDARPPLPEL